MNFFEAMEALDKGGHKVRNRYMAVVSYYETHAGIPLLKYKGERIPDAGISADEHCCEWEIFEEPKESKVLWEKATAEKDHHINIKINGFIGANEFATGLTIRFGDRRQSVDWFHALRTFMLLKGHRLAMSLKNGLGKFVIRLDDTMDPYAQEMPVMPYRMTEISPSFADKIQCDRAIEEIGKDNIIHMFKTFHGIYE